MNPKKIFKAILKICLSLAALWLVFQKIDVKEVAKAFGGIAILPLAGAFFLYNIGQFVSSVRLNRFFGAVQTIITEGQNLRLYYIGMFYNLFLPGGIGGDGYKVYVLNKAGNSGVLRLTKCVLADRISGLAAIMVIISVVFPATLFYCEIPYKHLLTVLIFAGGPAGYFIFMKLFFKEGLKAYFSTFSYSTVVQVLQVACALALAVALGIDIEFAEVTLLFLVSSIAAAIPLTFGGVGSRELVFLYGFQFLGADPAKGVSFTLLFFLMNAVSSLPGAFLNHK